jgi:hypothetical protein
MKFEYYDDKIVVYVLENNNIDYELILKKVFNELINNENIDLSSFYNVVIYINNYYGLVVEIVNEDNIKFENKININLNIIEDKLFLYEVDDPLEYIDNDVYYYNDKFYISLKNKNIKLLEYAKVIYDDFVYKVLGRGVKI